MDLFGRSWRRFVSDPKIFFSSELNWRSPSVQLPSTSPSLRCIVSTLPHSLDSLPLTSVNQVCNPPPPAQPFHFLLLQLWCRQSPSDLCSWVLVTDSADSPTPKPLPLILSSRPHLLSKFSSNPLFLRQHLYGPDRWAGYIYSVSVCWSDKLSYAKTHVHQRAVRETHSRPNLRRLPSKYVHCKVELF